MNEPFRRARMLSRRLSLALALVVAALALVFLWIAVDTLSGGAHLTAAMNRAYAPPTPFVGSPVQSALLLVIAAIQFALIARALLALRDAFGAIAAAEAIPPEAATAARRSGLAFLAAAIAMILAYPLNALAMSIGAPPGGRFLALSVSSGELLALFASGALLVFAHIIAVAAAIDEENRGFV